MNRWELLLGETLLIQFFRKCYDPHQDAKIVLHFNNVDQSFLRIIMKSVAKLPRARDKKAKFVELANKRVNRAIKDLELVANLANRRNYDFDDEQARKIVKALQYHVDALKQSFLSGNSGNQTTFEL